MSPHTTAGGRIMARRERLLPQRFPLVPGIGRQPAGASLPWHGLAPVPSEPRPRRWWALALGCLCLGLAGTAAHAQQPSPNQPMAIEGLPAEPCPLLVPGSDRALQPLRIQPSQVARKNAVGCLSPADAAVYGPDGCPVKLCHPPQGTVPLPQL